jgi:hypothetical protein
MMLDTAIKIAVMKGTVKKQLSKKKEELMTIVQTCFPE